MKKLTSKGKQSKDMKSSPHRYDIETSDHEKRVQMQDIGNTFEIKRQAT